MSNPTAIMLVIGNEILSGRTQDKNLHWVGSQLSEIGVRLIEARVIPDIEPVIISAVQQASKAADYVFTSGGIGPTHDDITTECVAKAFGVPVIRHPQAQAALEEFYTDKSMLNEARLRMANVPEGAELIPNPISAAPGYRIENVHVMAGVPSIFQAMFAHIKGTLKHGAAIRSTSTKVWVGEGSIAPLMGKLQKEYEALDIGSYPFVQNNKVGTSVVIRGVDEAAIQACQTKLQQALEELNILFEDE